MYYINNEKSNVDNMKKFGLMTLALMVTMGVFAQKGVEDGSRYGHGEDSINVIKNIAI